MEPLTMAATAVGIGKALGIGKENQIDQQRKLQQMQIQGNKEMADYNQQKQMEMWKDTNYNAQKEELKKAGLNPGLIYGMSGGGATTTGSGSGNGVTGGQAADTAATTNAATGQAGMGIQMASQLALMEAQKENIEADTANKKADAGYTAGAKTANTVADTGLKGKQELTQDELWTKAIRENNILDVTKESQIKKINAEAAGELLRNEATEAGIKLTEEQAKSIGQQLAQGWQKLMLEAKGQEINKESIAVTRANAETMAKAILWGAGINAAGNIVKSVTDVFLKKKFGGTNTEHTSTTEKGEGWSTTNTNTRTY